MKKKRPVEGFESKMIELVDSTDDYRLYWDELCGSYISSVRQDAAINRILEKRVSEAIEYLNSNLNSIVQL